MSATPPEFAIAREPKLTASQTAIAGVVVVQGRPHIDHRGAFMRLYCEQELGSILGGRRVVQINHSRTATIGAVRGMHYQRPPHAEMKLVRCIRGRVWDVAVDLRRGSPTFLESHGLELTPENGRMLVVPEGCAHGFQALAADSELLYLHTAFFTRGRRRRLLHRSPPGHRLATGPGGPVCARPRLHAAGT